MEKNVVPVFIGKEKLKDIIKVPARRSYRFRSREFSNVIQVESKGLSRSERMQVLDLVKKMNRKRKRSKEPRLLYLIQFKD